MLARGGVPGDGRALARASFPAPVPDHSDVAGGCHRNGGREADERPRPALEIVHERSAMTVRRRNGRRSPLEQATPRRCRAARIAPAAAFAIAKSVAIVSGRASIPFCRASPRKTAKPELSAPDRETA
ncbi:hypothetical protein GCM10007904_19570 [Oharaeibacter diazotrophicus]|nr:hypothetical protein GCM10007904_19570 [Oharaeibacter diazotrophicus]